MLNVCIAIASDGINRDTNPTRDPGNGKWKAD